MQVHADALPLGLQRFSEPECAETQPLFPGAGLRLEHVAEHPVDWWAGHRDVRPDQRGRVPLSFSVVAS